MNDEILKVQLDYFTTRFSSETRIIKSQVHFQSVVNIANQLIKIYNKSETEPYKQYIFDYIEKLKNIDFPTGKLTTSRLYKEYLLKPGQYLIGEKDFTTSAGVIFGSLILGMALDGIVYYFFNDKLPFYFPIITIIFGTLGYWKKKKAIKEKRFFGIGF